MSADERRSKLRAKRHVYWRLVQIFAQLWLTSGELRIISFPPPVKKRQHLACRWSIYIYLKSKLFWRSNGHAKFIFLILRCSSCLPQQQVCTRKIAEFRCFTYYAVSNLRLCLGQALELSWVLAWGRSSTKTCWVIERPNCSSFCFMPGYQRRREQSQQGEEKGCLATARG